MIYIAQLIYLHEGQEDSFNDFESYAIPIIANYNGELLFRLRPNENSYIKLGSIEKPYEIHLIKFDCENNFIEFMEDEDRKKYLHLRDKSIKVSYLIKGEML